MSNNHGHRSLYGPLLALMAVACGVASCSAPIDLSAVSSYANTTAQSATAFSAVAQDFEGSCERFSSVILGLVQPEVAAQQAPVVVSSAPPKEAFLLPSNMTPAPGYTAPPEAYYAEGAGSAPRPLQFDPQCADARTVSAAWDHANTVVLNYVQALGNLAKVDAVPSPNPSPLVAGLAKAGVSSGATQALSGLVTAISGFFVNKTRNSDIKKFLEDVNPHMPGTVAALEVTDASYTIELDAEFTKVRAQYADYVIGEIAARDALPGNDRNGRAAVDRRLAITKGAVLAALASINQHLRSSQDYGNAISGILKTHQALYKEAEARASFANYLNIIKTTGQPVLSDLQDLMKAVK